MSGILRSCVLLLAIAAASGAFISPWQISAAACPGCKNATATDPLLPKAYMYSILFMLAMPATVFTGFGIAFYRLSRKAALEQQALMDAENESPAAESTES